MKLINKISYAIVCFMVLSCTDSNDMQLATLQTYLQTTNYTTGSVIACAASDQNTNSILVFYYPEVGATNIRFYQTDGVDIDPNNFSNYQQVFIESEPFFNGYLEKFTQKVVFEKWIVVTFQLEEEVKVSNPIRSKQISKPTVWSEDVDINQSESGMPKFTWADNLVGDNAIYFQVISDAQKNLLSGTYTFENQFQYYNTSNVVLNITRQAPPVLILDDNYNFTLMDVSEDNWVNLVVNSKKFIAQ